MKDRTETTDSDGHCIDQWPRGDTESWGEREGVGTGRAIEWDRSLQGKAKEAGQSVGGNERQGRQ